MVASEVVAFVDPSPPRRCGNGIVTTPLKTVLEPVMIVSGGPAQVAISPTLAAGKPPISTVGAPGGKIGPPTCGDPLGLAMGQVCISETRVAGGMVFDPFN